MKNKSDFIDLTITPENAKQKGYKYIDDIIFTEHDPNEEILELINEYGCKLGSPSRQNETDTYYGLYMPMEEGNKG